jgi:hypothetical protein
MANTSPPVSYDTTVRYDLGTQVDTLLPVAFENLVAWYPFRSGTGEDITAGDSNFGDTTDYSATVNGATFQASGGVTDIQTGANSGAFDFDGVDDTLDAGAKQALSPASFTLISVSNADVTKSNMRLIHTRGPLESGGFTVSNEGDSIKFDLFDSGFNNIEIARQTVGTFVTIAASYDNGTARLNANGGEATRSANIPYDHTQFNSFEIAPKGKSDSPRFDGVVDEVRLYSPALSQSQINQIHNNINP